MQLVGLVPAMASNPLVCAFNQGRQDWRRQLMAESIVDVCKAAAETAAAFDEGHRRTRTAMSDQLLCILTYDGDGLDVAINYVLLVVNLFVCASQLRSVGPRRGVSQQEHRRETRGRRAAKAVSALAFVVAFQILLCFAVRCVGISIVWCAMMGWIACERSLGVPREPEAHRRMAESDPILQHDEAASTASASAATAADASSSGPRADLPSDLQPSRASDFELLDFLIVGALAVDLLGIVYYGIAMPAITTVAHVCAIGLGSLCWWLTVSQPPSQ